MSVVYNNIVAIRGEKEEVVRFLNAGLKNEIRDIDYDSALELEGLTLRSWLSGKDSFESNCKELGVKHDSKFDNWECLEDDIENTILCGYCNTTPWFPETWLETVRNEYLGRLDFYIFTVNEDGEWAGYYDCSGGEWAEKIKKPIYASEEEMNFFNEEIEALRERFEKYIAY